MKTKKEPERRTEHIVIALGIILAVSLTISFNSSLVSAQHIDLSNASYVFVLNITGSNITQDNANIIDGDPTFIFTKYNTTIPDIILINAQNNGDFEMSNVIFNTTNFTAILKDWLGNPLASTYFDPIMRFFSWDLNFTAPENLTNFTASSMISFVLPYSASARGVQVSLNGSVLFTYQLPPNNICNHNGICENNQNYSNGSLGMFESYETCPSDCKLNAYDGICSINTSVSDNYFNDGMCDPDCPADTVQGGECYTNVAPPVSSGGSPGFEASFIAIFSAAMVAVVLLSRKFSF